MSEIKVSFGALEAARADVAGTATRISGQLGDLQAVPRPAGRRLGRPGRRRVPGSGSASGTPPPPIWPACSPRSESPSASRTTATVRSSRSTPPGGGDRPGSAPAPVFDPARRRRVPSTIDVRRRLPAVAQRRSGRPVTGPGALRTHEPEAAPEHLDEHTTATR